MYFSFDTVITGLQKHASSDHKRMTLSLSLSETLLATVQRNQQERLKTLEIQIKTSGHTILISDGINSSP